MKARWLPLMGLLVLSSCAGPTTVTPASPPPCEPLTETICVGATDYALRVRNEWDRTVAVMPWSGAPSTAVPPGSDLLVPTERRPPAPWKITVRSDQAVIWTHMLRGTQDEFGPSNPPFPVVYSYFIGIHSDGTIGPCPGTCGST